MSTLWQRAFRALNSHTVCVAVSTNILVKNCADCDTVWQLRSVECWNYATQTEHMIRTVGIHCVADSVLLSIVVFNIKCITFSSSKKLIYFIKETYLVSIYSCLIYKLFRLLLLSKWKIYHTVEFAPTCNSLFEQKKKTANSTTNNLTNKFHNFLSVHFNFDW